MEPITLGDVAEMLGMSRQGADKLVKREESFPAPMGVVVGRTRVWEREAVERWAAVNSPSARKEYIAWVLGRVPTETPGSASNMYRTNLQMALSAALGPKRGQDGRPPTVIEAHRIALQEAQKTDSAFDSPAPPSIEDWARQVGRIQ